jgi:signal transduction histidine kinase
MSAGGDHHVMSAPPPAADARPHRPRTSALWKAGVVFLSVAGVADAVFNYALMKGLGRPQSFWFMATATVPSWLILAALLPVVFFMAARFPVHDRPLARVALVHLPVALGLAVVHLLLAVLVSDVVLSTRAEEVGFAVALGRGLSNYLFFDVLVYAGIVGLYHASDYRQRYRRQTEAAARLQVQLARAQLDALRTQLDPHFLFNALNAISGTALRRDPERTAGLISDLGHLLRRSLRQPSPEVSLADEIEFLEAYLSIERARMGGRLEVEVDVPEELRACPVPSLLLQPLVENAIRHGLAQRPAGGRLGVVVREREEGLVVEIWDDGPGFDPQPRAGSAPTEGVGLGNTRARLRELYGGDARLTLANRDEGGARVVVEIPAGRRAGSALRTAVG